MLFRSIRLENFRNYKEQEIEFHDKLNLFLGENAQGKSNLLEALFIMGLGKSFRTNRDSEMIAFGENFARASCLVEKDERKLGIDIYYQKEGKIIKVDGIKLNRSIELLENVYIVIFSPDYEGVIAANNQIQNVDYTPYEGFKVKGQARTVFVNGESVVHKGSIVKERQGRYVY